MTGGRWIRAATSCRAVSTVSSKSWSSSRAPWSVLPTTSRRTITTPREKPNSAPAPSIRPKNSNPPRKRYPYVYAHPAGQLTSTAFHSLFLLSVVNITRPKSVLAICRKLSTWSNWKPWTSSIHPSSITTVSNLQMIRATRPNRTITISSSCARQRYISIPFSIMMSWEWVITRFGVISSNLSFLLKVPDIVSAELWNSTLKVRSSQEELDEEEEEEEDDDEQGSGGEESDEDESDEETERPVSELLQLLLVATRNTSTSEVEPAATNSSTPATAAIHPDHHSSTSANSPNSIEPTVKPDNQAEKNVTAQPDKVPTATPVHTGSKDVTDEQPSSQPAVKSYLSQSIIELFDYLLQLNSLTMESRRLTHPKATNSNYRTSLAIVPSLMSKRRKTERRASISTSAKRSPPSRRSTQWSRKIWAFRLMRATKVTSKVLYRGFFQIKKSNQRFVLEYWYWSRLKDCSSDDAVLEFHWSRERNSWWNRPIRKIKKNSAFFVLFRRLQENASRYRNDFDIIKCVF